MTVSVQNMRVVHTGNGVTTNWPANFSALDDGDVEVYLYNLATADLQLLSGAVYNINGVPGDTFSIDYPLVGSPIASTHKLIIQRIVDLLQPSTFSNTAGFDPATLTLRLDEQVRMIQQVNDAASRAIKVDISGTQDPDDFLEDLETATEAAEASAAAAAASAVTAGNSATAAQTAENNAETAEAAAEAAQAAAEAAAASVSLPPIVANTLLVANAAATLRENKTFAETRDLLDVDHVVNPKWHGVVGDGVANDAAAFQACVTAAAGRVIWIDGLTIRIPTGNEITLPLTGLCLRGKGKIIYEGSGNLFKAGTISTSTYPFVATAGQTVFTANDPYTGCDLEVFVNGARKPSWQYTWTHSLTQITITFISGGAALNDAVEIRAHRFTAAGLNQFNSVIIGSGVQIITTQTAVGRAFALAWPDAGFTAGRQFPHFLMESGAQIRGDDSGLRGFLTGIWLHGAYDTKINGSIYGVGANLLTAVPADDMNCQTAILYTGEFTPSANLINGAFIGFYHVGIRSNWSTLEGLMITNSVFLAVGWAVYWLARSNDVGLQLSMDGCHVSAFVGITFTDLVSQNYVLGNDFFQTTAFTPFFRYMWFASCTQLMIYGNTFQSFTVGANTGGVVLGNGVRGARIFGNYFIAADSTSNMFGVQTASGSSDSVIGPNSYENVNQAVLCEAGSNRIGVLTKGDVFTTPPGGAVARYSMAGTHWWIDEKWLVLQNAANQSIPNNTATDWVYTEVRDPESVWSAAPLTVPAWATRVRVKGNFKWAANATGTRYLRTLRGGAFIDVERSSVAMPINNSAQLGFDEEFTCTPGQALLFQLHQTSGGALNLEPSIVYVQFS